MMRTTNSWSYYALQVYGFLIKESLEGSLFFFIAQELSTVPSLNIQMRLHVLTLHLKNKLYLKTYADPYIVTNRNQASSCSLKIEPLEREFTKDSSSAFFK